VSAAPPELPREFNIARHLIESNLEADRGSSTAFVTAEGRLSFDEVHSLVRRAAGLIRDLGVQPEQRVALLLPDSPELIAAFFGAIWAGCVPVPILLDSSRDAVHHILADSRARLLLTTGEWHERLGSNPPARVGDVLGADGHRPAADMIAGAAPALEPAVTCVDEPAFWLYTSGSTGAPKGVMHSHRAMAVCAELYAKQTLGLRADDLSYSVAKMPFAYGLGATAYMPMSVGAAAVLAPARDAFGVVEDVARHRPTVLWGIPSIYSALLAIDDAAPLDASSLRLCVSAAEQLPAPLWHAFRERHGIEICEGIGTTELLHVFLSNRPGAVRPGTSGPPVPGYSVRCVSASGDDVVGEPGDLEVTGESLMLGYWNRVRETRRAICNETMRTGDKCIVDADGCFRFLGRDDDLFKVRGMWVSPVEVEEVLARDAAVRECAVVARAGRDGLTELTAFVVAATGSSNGVARTIAAAARRELPPYKAPRDVRLVDALPRTPTGKVDRKRLRALLAEERSA
jgi:benzoate-CoA ligase family protein